MRAAARGLSEQSVMACGCICSARAAWRVNWPIAAYLREDERGSIVEISTWLKLCLLCHTHVYFVANAKEEVNRKRYNHVAPKPVVTIDRNFSIPVVVICDTPSFLISTKAPNTIVKPVYCSSSSSPCLSEMGMKTTCRAQHCQTAVSRLTCAELILKDSPLTRRAWRQQHQWRQVQRTPCPRDRHRLKQNRLRC